MKCTIDCAPKRIGIRFLFYICTNLYLYKGKCAEIGCVGNSPITRGIFPVSYALLYHITLYHIALYHITLYRITLYHITLYHIRAYHITLSHHTLPNHTPPHDTLTHHTLPHNTLPHHTLPHHILPHLTSYKNLIPPVLGSSHKHHFHIIGVLILSRLHASIYFHILT